MSLAKDKCAIEGVALPGSENGKEAMRVKTLHPAMVKMVVLAFLMIMSAGAPILFAGQSTHRPIVMATIQGPTDYYGKWGELIYTEAFRRLNVNLVIKVYPLERANLMVSRKQVDGDIGRSLAFYESYPEEPIYFLRQKASYYTTWKTMSISKTHRSELPVYCWSLRSTPTCSRSTRNLPCTCPKF
jgi:hypothetical protein